MITNNSYLDGLIHRGMRGKLLQSFSEIYIVNLHGDSVFQERGPDGSRDENVFEIQQGVSISIFIKKKGEVDKPIVQYCDLWGSRKAKHDYLSSNSTASTVDWINLSPSTPNYFLTNKNLEGITNFEKHLSITEIFISTTNGIKTHRDSLVIDFDKNTLRSRINNFVNPNISLVSLQENYKLKNSGSWNLERARAALIKDGNYDSIFNDVLYRPFDNRIIFYSSYLIDRARFEVMRHMMYDNIGIMTLRKGLPGYEYSWVFCSDKMISHGVYYLGNKGNEYIFPLYLYPDTDKKDLLNHHLSAGERVPNINEKIFDALKKAYGKATSPEEIFNYIYAVLYSPTYRTKYAEFLKIDFPRVPFTSDKSAFKAMGKLGAELVELHLMKHKALARPIAKFEGKGDYRVEKLIYDEEAGRLYINKTQYFEGITPEVYGYQIGGYQVANKWLKDRKDRALGLEDIAHYLKVITALARTMEIQAAIDGIYPEAEKSTVKL